METQNHDCVNFVWGVLRPGNKNSNYLVTNKGIPCTISTTVSITLGVIPITLIKPKQKSSFPKLVMPGIELSSSAEWKKAHSDPQTGRNGA